MTEILTLNGWNPGIADESLARAAAEPIGPRGRGVRGQLRRGERGFLFQHDMRTAPLDAATADALQGLLLGDFYHFPFDGSSGLYSEGAFLGPDAGYIATLNTAGPTPKFGTHSMRITSSGSHVTWTVTNVTSWTMAWWHNWNNSSPGANSWTHYVVTYDADTGYYRVYTNGALTYGPSASVPTSPGNFYAAVSSGTGVFGLKGKKTDGTSTATANFDDLVISRFVWPADLVTSIYNSGTGRAFSREPFLDMGGALINSGTEREVSGAVTEQPYLQANLTSTWAMNLRTVAFNLQSRERW